jgi:hypothetical protein
MMPEKDIAMPVNLTTTEATKESIAYLNARKYSPFIRWGFSA